MPLDVEDVEGIRTSYPSPRRVTAQLKTEFGELLLLKGSNLPNVTKPAKTIDWKVMLESSSGPAPEFKRLTG